MQDAQPLRDRALVGAGVSSKLDAQASVYLRYDGDINGHDDAHAVTGGVRFTW
jgi:outer membrane autotransporter protein